LTLPVADLCPALLLALQQQRRVILTAPPGAGKSTYLPLFLLQAPEFANKQIIMLEPRRLAAKSIASYLAEQLGEPLGETVGYQIRFEQKQTKRTRLLVVTEGVLIRKIQQDPELSSVDLLIFDEFHERSLQTDLALALALEVQQLNSELCLLLMSATMDTTKLSTSLQAPVLVSEGRSYPVEIRYQPPNNEPMWLQVAKLAAQLLIQHEGNFLLFLPGQREIEQAADYLAAADLPATVAVLPLLGKLSLSEQQQAVAAPATGKRKIVLATNIAETSLTIDGITLVIDSGQARQASYVAKLGFSRLDTVQISQAAATQRAGRAGRLMPGICYRFDTEEKWRRRAAFTTPEILQADLLALRLDVAAWGCQIADLFWLDAPPASQLKAAEQALQLLGALDERRSLTALGRRMLTLPVAPRLAAMLLFAQQLEQLGEAGAIELAAILAVQLEQNRRFNSTDLSRQLRLEGANSQQQFRQLMQLFQVKGSSSLPSHLVPLLLSHAYPDRIAIARGQGYLLANGTGAVLPAEDALSGQPVLVVADLRIFQQQALISAAVPWDLTALTEAWQAKFVRQTFVGFDEQTGRFQAEQQTKLGELVIKKQSLTNTIEPLQRQQAWLNYLRQRQLTPLTWSTAVVQLQHRVALAKQLAPEQWPDFSLASLTETIEQWLGPYLLEIKSLQQLQAIDLKSILLNQFSYAEQQQLQQLLPEMWTSLLGTPVALDYRADGEVFMEIRLGEMFGQQSTPTVANGKITVTVALLSPARRPLQVTRDLVSFWQNAYQDVKKEMRGRYPKHYWPDDPLQADPTNKTKKAMQK
jgi:ATP-dependent helicase HrpB